MIRERLAVGLVILAGGLLGSTVRALVDVSIPRSAGGFPTATLMVNLVGSFGLGWYLARRNRAVVGRWSLQFWAIGVLGSFTTFSAFSIEVFRLIEAGSAGIGMTYVLVSTLGGLFVAHAGGFVGAVQG